MYRRRKEKGKQGGGGGEAKKETGGKSLMKKMGKRVGETETGEKGNKGVQKKEWRKGSR